jgi:4-alpha-glucanotransferase
VPIPLVPEITYRYAVVDDSMSVITSASNTHTLLLPQSLEDGSIIDIYDEWMDRSHPGYLLSTCAFTKVILPDRPRLTNQTLLHLQPTLNEAIIRFQVWDWEVQGGQEMCVSGGAPQLGNWQTQQVLQMTQVAEACWEAEVSVPLNAFPVTYKYAVGDKTGESLLLEHGESRIVALPMSETSRAPAVLVRHDGHFRRERRWRGAGVAVPVFSIRTKNSLGCGEFSDLALVAKWCASVGLKMLQLLPVADTSVRGDWRDSYPYSSLCVFALHPMYLNVSQLGNIEKTLGGSAGEAERSLPENILKEIESAHSTLSSLPDVDYEGTMKAKLRIARAVFDCLGQETMQSDAYLKFSEENVEWLRPYSVFCFLRDLFGTAEHWNWGVFAHPTPEMLLRLSSEDQEWHASIQFHCFLQFHLHQQLAAASATAAAHQVALKGDLPIGVDKRSVDTWLYPKLFHMDTSTGAPPDAFAPGGQNWGFPTYNWDEMERDNYSWWKRRLQHMSQYFQAYRIDHVLGFFRIWELPATSRTGLLGRFRPSAPIWRHELESKGIWDFDRLCEPYVTNALLERTFGEGELASEVAARYFVDGPGRRLKFKKQFSTEAALFNLQPRPGLPKELADEVHATRKGLLALRQNVLLLRDPEDPERFYPRFALSSTSSFRDLDLQWRDELSRLHDDYYHGNRSESLWREQALRTLPVLQDASDMLVCGEDLGMIPSCVHPIMEELGIVGLRIQRMPSECGVEFGDPGNYPYMTVASPSSHDTSTLRAWYNEDVERGERFYIKNLGGEGTTAPEVCTPEIAAAVIEQHLESNSVLAIFPLQDFMATSAVLSSSRPAEEETINDPTNAEHYWKYRMHVNVEDLIDDYDLKMKLRSLLLASGRAEKEDFSHS